MRGLRPASRGGSTGDRRFLEFLGVVKGDHLVEDFSRIALQDVVEPVGREVDAVIGDAALREGVGPDFFRPFTGSHLAAARLGDGFLFTS